MKTLLAVIIILITSISFSQQSELGNWMIYFGNKKLNDKFNLHHEVQYRNYNAIGDLEQLLLRGGIGYNLTPKNNNVLLGYGFIRSENYLDTTDKKNIVNEHRIYQQFITKQHVGRVYIQHRYRFEQRFIETNFKARFRYFLALNIALNNKELTDKTFYFSAYNEIFINNANSIFDRNRLYGGLGYRVNNSLRFELGYMNQFLNGNQRDQLNMIVGFNF